MLEPKTLETQSIEPNLKGYLAKVMASRKGNPTLNLDVDIATCEVLAALSGGDTLPADAFNHLMERNRTLAQASEDEILDSLTRQSTLLESLWLHFAARAAVATRSDQAAILVKAALNCQRALGNVLGTIHHLNQSKRNVEAIEPA